MDIKTPKESSKAGNSSYKKGEYIKAAQHFEDAAQGFDVHEKTSEAAEMRNNQSVALLQAGDANEALQAAVGTDGIFANAAETRLQAMALGNIAAALDELDRYEEAEETYLRSAKIFDNIGEDKLRANVMQSLSKLQLRTGRQLQALATMQSGVDEIKRPNLRQRMLKKLLKTPLKLLNRR